MPKVPQYEPQVKATDTNLPRVKESSPAPEIKDYGSKFLGEVAKTAYAASDFFEKEQRKADEVVALEVDSELSAYTTDYLYNPKTGALNRKGKDAFGSVNEFDEAWKTKTQEIEKRISNNNQRLQFEKIKASRRNDVDRQLMRHVSVEAREYDNQVTQSLLENERDAATGQFMDGERTALAIAKSKDEIFKFAERDGKPPEWVAEKSREAESKIHMSILARALTTPGNETWAKQYHEKNKDFIDGDSQDNAAKMVREGTLRGASQSLADQAHALYPKDEVKALKWIAGKTKSDAELREMSEGRTSKIYTREEQAEKQRQENVYQDGAKIIDSFLAKGQVIDPREKIPPALWNSVDDKYKKSWLERSKQIETVDAKWSEFSSLSAGAMASMSQSEYEEKFRNHFSSKDKEKADGWRHTAINRGEKDQMQTKEAAWINRFDETLRMRDIVDPSNPKKTDSDAKLYLGLKSEVRKAIEEFEIVTLQGKSMPTGEQIQGVIDDVVLRFNRKAKIKGTGYGATVGLDLFATEKTAAEMTPAERLDAGLPPKDAIPPASRAALEKRMKEAGKPITDDKLIRAYRAILNKDKAGAASIIAE